MRRLLAMSCVLLLGVAANARADPATRVLVRFAPDASPAHRAEVRRDAGVQRVAALAVPGLEVVDPKPGESVPEAVAELDRMRGVLYAEPDYEVRETAVPDDPLFPQEWGLAAISAPAAWDVTTGSPQVTVAVVDSGLDAADPDLAPNVGAGWDFVDDDAEPQDGNGHGTHVAGTIAARGNDAFGVAGVAWSASLMPLRVLDDAGRGFVSDLVNAYAFAERGGARIVNVSLGGNSFSRAEYDAIAAAPDLLFVAAAGNGTQDDDAGGRYPCGYDLVNVVCVAASDHDDALASFSNYGRGNVDLAAPGVDIVSTWPGRAFVRLSGTSMATPHVSGAAALVLAQNPDLTVAGLRAALLGSATAVPALAGRVATGARLDVAAALAAAPPPAPPPPPAGTTQPAPEPQPAAVPPPASPPAAAFTAQDRATPSLRLRLVRAGLRTVRRHGLHVVLSVSEPCSVSVVVRVAAGIQRRLRLPSPVLGRTTVHLTAAGQRMVAVRLSARARRAFRRVTRLRVVASAIAFDAAGNRGVAQDSATLRR
jgi:subtilisin family serine protease